ncbi:MAG: HAD hydrolase family protein [Chitinophagales bacterium]|nr:HAD hydrolase family protein [Chitinophagales bacterium]
MLEEKSDLQVPYFELFRSVAAFILDVDGVLTDGSLLITNSFDQLRTMNIRDGYALQLAVKKGFLVIVITGANSPGVVQRLNGLGILYVLANVQDKKSALLQIINALNIDLSKTMYIGDDIPDLEVMQLCGVTCCPQDAAPEIIAISKYISPYNGGKGCVRDILEKVMKLQDKWI